MPLWPMHQASRVAGQEAATAAKVRRSAPSEANVDEEINTHVEKKF